MPAFPVPAACLTFLRLLNAHAVEYVVIGGYAVAFHGYDRPILDLDVFVGTTVETAAKLVAVLGECGEGLDARALELFQLPERVIRVGQPPFGVERYAPNDRFVHLGSPPVPLEIMTSISAVTFAECYPARVYGRIDGVRVPIIGRAHLRLNKAHSIRPKDADDLAHLP